MKAKAKLLSEKQSSSKSAMDDDDDDDSPVVSRSPSLQRHDSSTSGISTGCDTEETERTALRKKRPNKDGNVQTTTRHFEAAHLPILGPIATNKYKLGSKDTLTDVDVSRFNMGDETIERECLNRGGYRSGNDTIDKDRLYSLRHSSDSTIEKDRFNSLRSSSDTAEKDRLYNLKSTQKQFPVLGVSGKQRILLEPLQLTESNTDKKSVVKKRRKPKKKRQHGRMAKSLEEEEEDEEEIGKVALTDRVEEKESYA